MRTRTSILLLASLLAHSACSDARATRVLLTIDADPAVRERTTAVRLQVVAGIAPQTRTVDETLALGGRAWPLHAVLEPLGADATRPVEVTLEALDARARVVSRMRAAPAFAPGQVREVALRFEAACLGVLSCGAGATCVSGRCAPVTTEPLDARVRADARVPRNDAGPACAMRTTYVDHDGDGYGDPEGALSACEASAGRVLRAGDCDDACASCRPDGSEVCDGAHDEDCDGEVDEGCACRFGDTRECEGGRDVCVRGVQTCVGDAWSECVGRVEAHDEDCDGTDDDCDGRIDEDLQRGCGRGCHSRCVLGVWGACRDDDAPCAHDD